MSAKILFLDIETAPMLVWAWGLFDQNIGLNQIHKDWHLLAWSAKWADRKEVMYMDQSKEKDVSNDKKLLAEMWRLLDEAQIVVTQNGKKFDIKKLNARFIINGFSPPSSYRHIDTLQLDRKHFGFTSNKLEYVSQKLCKKYKKLVKRQFTGFDLWTACMAGDKAAWKEMKTYNELDTLALEELYNIIKPWDNSVNFAAYELESEQVCSCGSREFTRNGFFFTNAGKYQRYKCSECGSESKDKSNLFSKEKKMSLRR